MESFSPHLLQAYSLGFAHQLWETSVSDQNFPLASLYAYRGAMRRLILDFKINLYWQTGQQLAEIFAGDERALRWIEDADALMPIPSSPWSRWQGRLDLAHLLASALSHRASLPLLRPPWNTFFRKQKQAFLPRAQRGLDGQSSSLEMLSAAALGLGKTYDSRPLKIVLIDDIVTSSKTLTAFALGFRNIGFKFLTLASAFRLTEASQVEVR